jgi:hypothetical protein
MVIFIVTQVIKNVKVGVCKIYHLQLLKKEFKKAKKKKKKKKTKKKVIFELYLWEFTRPLGGTAIN